MNKLGGKNVVYKCANETEEKETKQKVLEDINQCVFCGDISRLADIARKILENNFTYE